MARAKPKTTASIDLEGMTDDALTALAVAVKKEAQRRGIEAGVEVWASALGDEEATRIAREAAERETERLRAEQARQVAAEASLKVREAAERKRLDDAAAKAAEQSAKVRALAVRARELFGSDVACFEVKIWCKGGDKRVYVGGGYGDNWVEYYHTGNGRTAPGTISTFKGVSTALAAHLGIKLEEAKALIADYCRGICEAWESVTVEVNTSNAPLDPTAVGEKFAIKNKADGRFGKDGKNSWFVHKAEEADLFDNPEEALEAAAKYCGSRAHNLAASVEDVEAVPVKVRAPFPPKGA